jgi:hypothetical protein
MDRAEKTIPAVSEIIISGAQHLLTTSLEFDPLKNAA